jgi:hypothetical protein
MSKANITKTEHLDNHSLVTFDTDKGPMVYKFIGSSARALKKGADPSKLAGVLQKKKK